MHASAERRPGPAQGETMAILWEADPVTFQFTYVSPGAARLFGFTRVEWLTRTNFWVDLLHPRDRERAVDECRLAVDSAHDHEIEYRVRTRDGRVLWIRDLVRVITDDEGRPVALHGAMVDITRRRLLADQVARGHEMAALGELTRGISRGRAVAVDVNTELRAMPALLRHILGVGIDLEMALGAAVSRVRLAPGILGQIVLNLAINARDAMPAGGTLRLVTFDTPHVRRVGLPDTPPQLVLEIEDTGTGISAEVRARLFEPYFTTKGAQQASGLGLSTVDRVVREAGGHIEWASVVGQGTRFRVFLPLAGWTVSG